MTDLAAFWGALGDGGEAIGKFGTDAKPFVDRIKELADIALRVQARLFGLPESPSQGLLPGPDENAAPEDNVGASEAGSSEE